MRVLVVEDEPRLLDMLRDGLREHGYAVMTALDGEDGLALAQEHCFEVVVLDVMLPKLDGWQVLRELRRAHNPAFVLMLTARDGEHDVITGLEAGADDYLTKPFSFPELVARIKCVVRAKEIAHANRIRVETLILDMEKHQAFRAGLNLNLTRTEFHLLERLMRSPGEIVPRVLLIKAVWGEAPQVGRGTLDSFVNLLRKKVDSPNQVKLLHTVKGIGYYIRPESSPRTDVRGIQP